MGKGELHPGAELCNNADRQYNRPGAPARCGRKRGDKTTECIGKSKGGLTTKIHASCDALGNPTSFYLTPGQMHDLHGSDVLLPRILAKVKQFLAVCGKTV